MSQHKVYPFQWPIRHDGAMPRWRVRQRVRGWWNRTKELLTPTPTRGRDGCYGLIVAGRPGHFTSRVTCFLDGVDVTKRTYAADDRQGWLSRILEIDGVIQVDPQRNCIRYELLTGHVEIRVVRP